MRQQWRSTTAFVQGDRAAHLSPNSLSPLFGVCHPKGLKAMARIERVPQFFWFSEYRSCRQMPAAAGWFHAPQLNTHTGAPLSLVATLLFSLITLKFKLSRRGAQLPMTQGPAE